MSEQHQKFLLDVNSPEKLVEYFISNFIVPKAEEVDQGNVMIQKDNMNAYHMRICEKEIMLIIGDNSVNFVNSNSGDSVLRVEYENSIPKKVDICKGRFFGELEQVHLEEMMDEVFNKQ